MPRRARIEAMTRRHPADIERAAELTRLGVPQKEIAADIGVSPRQVQRWAHDPREHLFAPPPVPGSLDDLKRVHLEALGATLADGRPDHATRQ
jgi:transcriptional regulator with XRE-family HTH domain